MNTIRTIFRRCTHCSCGCVLSTVFVPDANDVIIASRYVTTYMAQPLMFVSIILQQFDSLKCQCLVYECQWHNQHAQYFDSCSFCSRIFLHLNIYKTKQVEIEHKYQTNTMRPSAFNNCFIRIIYK